MRLEIHPEYSQIKATCSCGNVILIKSTLKEDISLDVCSSCHPFYTGKQKLIDTGGRVERFEKRFGKKSSTQKSIEGSNEAYKETKIGNDTEIKEVETEAKAVKKAPEKKAAKKKEVEEKKEQQKKTSSKKSLSEKDLM